MLPVFALFFPIEMAVTKIGLSILLIALIPFLVKPERLLPVEGAHEDIACPVPGATQISLDTESWGEALLGTGKAVFKKYPDFQPIVSMAAFSYY